MIPGLSRIPKALKGTVPPIRNSAGVDLPARLALLLTVHAERNYREEHALRARASFVAWSGGASAMVRNLSCDPHPLAPFVAQAEIRNDGPEETFLHARLDVDSWSPDDLAAIKRTAKAWELLEARLWTCTEALGPIKTFADYLVRLLLITGTEECIVLKAAGSPWKPRPSGFDDSEWHSIGTGQVGAYLLQAGHRWHDAGAPLS